jgi:AraC-like DNA-binding protein
MNINLDHWDSALRGAAAALLLFQLSQLLMSKLERKNKFTLALFVIAVTAYLFCSHPDFLNLNIWLRWPVLIFCLLSVPVLWVAMQTIFEDKFSPCWFVFVLFLFTLSLGILSVNQIGGRFVNIFHKFVLIGFACATLWTVLKDWQSDLVSNRRKLRSWVAGSMGLYVLLELCFELFYANGLAPKWLELLNLFGIVVVTGLIALVIARHPIHEWLGADQSTDTLPVNLTAAPEVINRKAELRDRLLRNMTDERIYAAENLTLTQLALSLNASPTQLRETINQQLGYRNFNDFLHHYRVDEAAKRLLVQDLPILSIALEVGYASIGPFNRAFKQIKGMTPSEFRFQSKKSK